MAGDCPVDGDFLHVPSFLAVVAAFQDGRSVSAGEARRAVGCVGEFLGQFLCRLAVTDVVAAVTVGGDGIQAIIAQAAGDKHDFSRRSNFIIYKFFLIRINLCYCLIFFLIHYKYFHVFWISFIKCLIVVRSRWLICKEPIFFSIISIFFEQFAIWYRHDFHKQFQIINFVYIQ